MLTFLSPATLLGVSGFEGHSFLSTSWAEPTRLVLFGILPAAPERLNRSQGTVPVMIQKEGVATLSMYSGNPPREPSLFERQIGFGRLLCVYQTCGAAELLMNLLSFLLSVPFNRDGRGLISTESKNGHELRASHGRRTGVLGH